LRRELAAVWQPNTHRADESGGETAR
jgi:hypothetical protein